MYFEVHVLEDKISYPKCSFIVIEYCVFIEKYVDLLFYVHIYISIEVFILLEIYQLLQLFLQPLSRDL